MTTSPLRSAFGAFIITVFVAAGIFVPGASAEAATAPGSLTVQLVTPTGAPWKVEGVGVSANAATTEGSVYTRVATDKSGVAAFPTITGGSTVTIQALTFEYQYEFTPTVKSGVAVAPGQAVKTTVTVARGGVVEGTVTLPTGVFKYGQVVAVDSLGNAVANTSTDAKGKYSLRGLKSGTYAIQFNGRNWADSKIALVTKYGWGYYGGGSLQTSKKVVVKAQNSATANTVTTGINGAVPYGPVATFTLATAASGGQLNIEKITGGKTIVAETVYSPLYSATDKVRLNWGTYRLAVEYVSGQSRVQYFYTGPGKPLSKEQKDAVLFTVGSGDIAVKVGPRP